MNSSFSRGPTYTSSLWVRVASSWAKYFSCSPRFESSNTIRGTAWPFRQKLSS